MELSPQQEAVMQWAISGSGHLNLIARAGTGKTTTLIELCSRVQGTIFLGAYNKKIAEEIKVKLAEKGIKNANASTMHAAGFGAWKKVSPSCTVEEGKLRDICKKMDVQRDRIAPISNAVSLAKQSLFSPETPAQDWENLWDNFELELDLPFGKEILQTCQEVLRESIRLNDSVIDFDDMLYAPLVANCRIPSYDWVLIDEAQDTNAARRELAIRMLNGKGRLIAVGDERQAIYGFTGADSQAMALIKQRLGSTDLPLTVTYRCPKLVVKLAQSWVPDIEAFHTNREGIVDMVHEDRFSVLSPRNEDVILCRNTKPLISLAFDAIRQGRGVRVEGRAIGEGLLKLAKQFKEDSLRAILPRLEIYLAEESNRLREKGKEGKIEELQDRCEALGMLISQTLQEGGNSIDSLKGTIEGLFGDTYGRQTILTLSTIHKAKGREWGHVWIYGRNRYQPSYYARLSRERGVPWPMQQEDNLCYVAVTRAKERLTDIWVEPPLPKKGGFRGSREGFGRRGKGKYAKYL